MNTIVTSQIAKLLEEKGFDEPCYDAYNSRGNRYSDGWCEYIDVGTPFTKSDLKGKYTLAPTIGSVVMWLYEKYGIWICVNREVIGSDEWEYSYTISYLPKEYENYKRRSIHLITVESFKEGIGSYIGAWHSPTEAYLAAIDYTLNNLI